MRPCHVLFRPSEHPAGARLTACCQNVCGGWSSVGYTVVFWIYVESFESVTTTTTTSNNIGLLPICHFFSPLPSISSTAATAVSSTGNYITWLRLCLSPTHLQVNVGDEVANFSCAISVGVWHLISVVHTRHPDVFQVSVDNKFPPVRQPLRYPLLSVLLSSSATTTLPLQVEWGSTMYQSTEPCVWALGPCWVVASPLNLRELLTLYALGPHFCGPFTSATYPPLSVRSFETVEPPLLFALNPRTAHRNQRDDGWQLYFTHNNHTNVSNTEEIEHNNSIKIGTLSSPAISISVAACPSNSHSTTDSESASLRTNIPNITRDIVTAETADERTLVTTEGAVECILSTPLPLVFLSVAGVEFFFLLLERMISRDDRSPSSRGQSERERSTTQFVLILRALVTLWTFPHPLISHLLFTGRAHEMLAVFLTLEAHRLTPECVSLLVCLACECPFEPTTIPKSVPRDSGHMSESSNSPRLMASSPAVPHLLLCGELWRRTSRDVQMAYWQYMSQRLLAHSNCHYRHNLNVLHHHHFLRFVVTAIDHASRHVHPLIAQTFALLLDTASPSDLQAL
jgi:hypothetical protein